MSLVGGGGELINDNKQTVFLRKGKVIHHYSNFFYLTLFSYNHGTTLQALFEYLVEQSDN